MFRCVYFANYVYASFNSCARRMNHFRQGKLQFGQVRLACFSGLVQILSKWIAAAGFPYDTVESGTWSSLR